MKKEYIKKGDKVTEALPPQIWLDKKTDMLYEVNPQIRIILIQFENEADNLKDKINELQCN